MLYNKIEGVTDRWFTRDIDFEITATLVRGGYFFFYLNKPIS